jgi:hypothetical protein
MYWQVLFAAIHGDLPSGQLKLFKFIPDEFVGRDVLNPKLY